MQRSRFNRSKASDISTNIKTSCSTPDPNHSQPNMRRSPFLATPGTKLTANGALNRGLRLGYITDTHPQYDPHGLAVPRRIQLVLPKVLFTTSILFRSIKQAALTEGVRAEGREIANKDKGELVWQSSFDYNHIRNPRVPPSLKLVLTSACWT